MISEAAKEFAVNTVIDKTSAASTDKNANFLITDKPSFYFWIQAKINLIRHCLENTPHPTLSPKGRGNS
jgi:hypothetical protein